MLLPSKWVRWRHKISCPATSIPPAGVSSHWFTGLETTNERDDELCFRVPGNMSLHISHAGRILHTFACPQPTPLFAELSCCIPQEGIGLAHLVKWCIWFSSCPYAFILWLEITYSIQKMLQKMHWPDHYVFPPLWKEYPHFCTMTPSFKQPKPLQTLVVAFVL